MNKQVQQVRQFWGRMSSGQQLFVVILIILIIWIARNYLKGRAEAIANGIKATGEIATLQAAGKKASYSQATYEKFADNLEGWMDGLGTNSTWVIKTMSYLNNDIDFIKLDTAFGVRSASDDFFGLIGPSDLKGWIRGDLGEPEIAAINKMFASKGITKRF